MKVAQLCPTLCDPVDYTVYGILQPRILEWVVIPFSRGSSQPRDRTQVSHSAGGFLTTGPLVKVKVAQLCLTLCNPMDYTVHGILHSRILEWVAFPFSRESPQPRDRTRVSHIAGGFFTNWAIRETPSYSFPCSQISILTLTPRSMCSSWDLMMPRFPPR